MLDGISSAEGLITIGYQPWTDYNVETSTTIVTPPDASYVNREATVVFRYNDPINFYWAGLGAWNKYAAIARVVNGIYEPIASVGVDTDVNYDQPYTLKVVVKGSLIQLYVNNALTLEASDASLPSGGIGLRVFNSHAQFDYISAASPTPGIGFAVPLILLGIGAAIALS